MKCTCFRLLCSLIFFSLASTTNAQVHVSAGPEVGFTASGLYTDDQSDIFAGLNGHFGGTAHVQFGRFLAIRPSVLFKVGNMSHSDYTEQKISLNRIAVPIPILFSYVFRNDGLVFIGAGPNFQYAFSGKTTYDSTTNISFGSGPGQWKRMDVGLHLKGGYQFPIGIGISTFANFGFTTLASTGYSQIRSLDAIGFSLSYMFGARRDD